jgi:hypothetical protein
LEPILSLTVPAGEYVVEAKTSIFGSKENEASQAECLLAPPGSTGNGELDATTVTLPQVAGRHSEQALSLLGAERYASPQQIDFSCRTVVGEATIDNARLIATRVGTAHGAPLPHD